MKVLFLTSRFPYPLIQGDRVRSYNQLRLLSQRHEITLLSPITSPNEYAGLENLQSICKIVEVFPRHTYQGLLNLSKNLFSPLPWQVSYSIDNRIKSRVCQLLKYGKFDVVHTQLARTVPMVDSLTLNSVPKVIDMIDALSLNMERRANREKGIISKLLHYEAKKMSIYERQVTSRFHHAVVVSEIDRAKIGDFSNLHVIPNGVNLQEFNFRNSDSNSQEIVFTGNMNYFPNIDAVKYFTGQVLPLVKEQCPKAKFTVVGANPPQSLKNQCEDATFTGYVPHIRDYLTNAAVSIAPMQSGSGMQNKILEAMAIGVPVVTTSYGMGGLKAQHGKHLLVADSPQDLAFHVITLLKNYDLQRRIALSAYDYVKQYYSWGTSISLLEDLYNDAINDVSSRVNQFAGKSG